MSNLKNKIVFFVTSDPTSAVVFLLPHLKVLSKNYDVQVLANCNDVDLLRNKGVDVPVNYVRIERQIRPAHDFIALWSLFHFFRQNRPDAVHSITPKAGLLTMASAWLARVPVRVHTFTGQVWVTRTGVNKVVLKLADKLIALFATEILVDSPTQKEFLVNNKIVSPENSAVLGSGSICGVDLHRFKPDDFDRQKIRSNLAFKANDVVILYLGRLNKDKGMFDLAKAFCGLAINNNLLKLLLVGPDEEGIYGTMLEMCDEVRSSIFRVGFTSEPECYMRAADIFCLPSYREGFGSSVIEAAACQLPAVASRIYGLTDAVSDGVTGLLFERGSVPDLIDSLKMMSDNEKMRKAMGGEARVYVERNFSQSVVTTAMLEFYKRALCKNS